MPIHTQLGEQLKHHIEEGTWRPGAQLPVVRHLAGSLGINYNTVRAVYRDLARSGYVVSKQGRGTFVAASPPSSGDPLQRVRDRIDDVLLEAKLAGVPPNAFALLAYRRAKLFAPETARVRLLFVECNPAEVEFHSRTIAESTGLRPRGLLVSDLRYRGRSLLQKFDILATTLFHSAEVQEIVGIGREVLSLMVEPSYSEVVARLTPLSPGSRVAVVCTSRKNARKIESALLGIGLTHLKFRPVAFDDEAAMKRVLRNVDEVYVSRMVSRLHKGSWPTSVPVRSYIDVLDATSLRRLRHEIANVSVKKRAGAYRGRRKEEWLPKRGRGGDR
jgi:GntR family transcriptional regulator